MRSCPLCQNDRELFFLWGTDLIRCPRCSLAYVDQLPTLEALRAIYSGEFFKGYSAYADYVRDKAGMQRHFRKRLNTLRQYSRGGKLFEAGCAHGFFLELARGYWDVSGIDISEEAVDYARTQLGLEVEVGTFETHPLETNTYNVVPCGIRLNISTTRCWPCARAPRP